MSFLCGLFKHKNNIKMRVKLNVVLLIVVIFGNTKLNAQDTIPTKITLDTLGNEVYYLTTSSQKPIAYYSPIFTPVCLDGTCYPIHINLFWDLGGNYLKYTLDSTEILTKIEHLPFTAFDYGLLHRVIANSKSALADFTIHELTDPNESKVDGVTGATRPELQGAFVPDALYTSYTLWHLARNPTLKIQAFTTQNLFKTSLFNQLLSNPKYGAQKLALNYLIAQNPINDTIASLIPIIDTTDNTLTVKCLELIPITRVNKQQVRQMLCNTYLKSDNLSVKETILKKWTEEVKPAQLEAITVANVLGDEFGTFQAEVELLAAVEIWPTEIYDILFEKSSQLTNMMRKEKINRLLFSREANFPKQFKRKLKKHH